MPKNTPPKFAPNFYPPKIAKLGRGDPKKGVKIKIFENFFCAGNLSPYRKWNINRKKNFFQKKFHAGFLKNLIFFRIFLKMAITPQGRPKSKKFRK